MTGSRFAPMKSAVAMLCLALALVFAMGSARGIVDRIEHQAQPDARYAHICFSDFTYDSAHADHQDDGGASDCGQGAGHHHHGDSPQGALGADQAPALVTFAAARLDVGSDQMIHGAGPPRLDRPPKHLTTRV